jgi:VHL beta domain
MTSQPPNTNPWKPWSNHPVVVFGGLTIAVLSLGGTLYSLSSTSVNCSQGSLGSDGRTTQIVFNNETNRALILSWIDFEGREKVYGTIAPGNNQIQTTGIGHAWCVREESSNKAVKFVVGKKDAQIVNVR